MHRGRASHLKTYLTFVRLLSVRTRRPENGRERLLDAAATRLVERGYAATTLRELAADIGIKAGSIYHHFPSKEDLFIEVFRRGIEVMVDAFLAVDTDGNCSPDGTQRLEAHVRAHLGALFEHGSYTAAHVTAFFTAPDEVRAAVVPLRDDYEHRWNVLLAELLPDLDDRRRPLARLLLFGAMNTTIEWFDVDGNLSLDELSALVTHQFLGGVNALTHDRSTR